MYRLLYDLLLSFNTARPCGRLRKVSSPEDMNIEKILNPWASYSRFWSKIFLASCVIGVSVDPLFLYIPIIHEEKKCLAMDENMKIVAVVLRTLTDFTYVLHLIFRLKNALTMAKLLGSSIYKGFPWPYLLIDILAILPIPQVIILNFFSTVAGSRSFTGRKILDILLLLQYVPRILRVYLSARDLGRNFDSLTRLVWLKGAFNFFLYVIVGHVFGALWYFHSFLRETACWHHAFTDNTDYRGCNHSPFDCHGSSIKNLTCLTHLTKFCPVDPPNSEVFDFGIFTDAIKSRILYKKEFLRKFSRSFWWGLQNLSSFGQNLDTSSNIEENFFAVLISILGLLLFLYLVGNLQVRKPLIDTLNANTFVNVTQVSQ
ncbi:Ion transport domain containing protein [Trema orientale]|uniref:Ion transport domain containing protein n=1 Tax=Trema orientale TaxID=63057 RepID=A0A2P5FGW6_TREOI|nr:Ion transport domain containing protein [Trema orientale]